MEIANGLEKLSSVPTHTAIAIGNFDGVHLGHQKILRFLVQKAKKEDLLSMVLTFSPHPEKVLGKNPIRMIQTLNQRLKEIKNFHIQSTLVVPFNKKFSDLSSIEFTQKILINHLKTKVIILGEHFRFGKNRKGDISFLQHLTPKFNFQVFSIPSVTKKGEIVSSSLIRSLLMEGKIEKANVFLGRSYEIEGKVKKGKSRGKILGFPTANIATRNEILPPGVFITTVRIESETFPSLTNVGECPTFDQKETNIESYIINFNRNLYGKKISVNFIKKIREEMKFKSPGDLTRQIKKDIETAKTHFKLK